MTETTLRLLKLTITYVLFGVTIAGAQSAPTPNARLVIRSGIVEVQRGNDWLPISVGTLLNPGEHIRTARSSRAAIEIGPRQVVTLNEHSMVTIGQTTTSGSPVAQLETGSMKVTSSSGIRVSAKDTVLESDGQPVDLELGYQGADLNLTIFNGAVKNGPMVIRGGNQDPSVRTYVANGRPWRGDVNNLVPNPNVYVFPYFLYGNAGVNDGRIVPPVVTNPTHPAYRPTQIVPPMPDPIRVPVTRR